MSTHSSAPRLRVSTPDQAIDFDTDFIVGRDEACDLVIRHPDVSRRHLEIRQSGETWYVLDAGSTNGSFVAGRRIALEPVIAALDIAVGGLQGVPIRVEPIPAVLPAQGRADGLRDDKPPRTNPRRGAGLERSPAGWLPAAQAPPGHFEHGHTVIPEHSRSSTLTIGRTANNDIVLDDPLVSRRHATLHRGRAATLTDLGSFNGTFVNGSRIHGSVRLNSGDQVSFGSQTFVWDSEQLSAKVTRNDLTLFVQDVSVTVKGGKRLLDSVNFALEPSSLTAVIGPSGAGKSTLLGSLTGLRPANHGTVIWQGHDLYSHYAQLRYQVGLVPQQDILHPQLTVRQGLEYAARLRLPPDTTPAERSRRIDTVISQMQLERQAGNRIGTQLSGGQRKRVSIATELLTAPPLLFLDEPTSGLDPGLDREVMHLLRRLSDEGRVVMVVTHSVLALDVCDNVLVLAPGGRVAYFGPPQGVLTYFGCQDYPEVFRLLDQPELVKRLPERRTGALPTGSIHVDAGPPAPPPQQSVLRQLGTLVERNLAVTASDKLLLALLIGMPLILAVLGRVVPGDAGLSIQETKTAAGLFNGAEASQRLTILIVAAALMGVSITIRELVKERPIFRREYAVGLSPGVYFLSKVLVLGAAAFCQGVLVTFLATIGLPGPDDSGVLGMGWFEIALAVGLLTFTMAVVGLTVSALVTSSEQTMPALVGLVMVQLVLSGALVKVAGRDVLEQIAWTAPARWAFAAAAASVDWNKSLESIPDSTIDELFKHTARQYAFDLSMMGILCVLTLLVGLALTIRSARE